jgi:hypothetical protein
MVLHVLATDPLPQTETQTAQASASLGGLISYDLTHVVLGACILQHPCPDYNLILPLSIRHRLCMTRRPSGPLPTAAVSAVRPYTHLLRKQIKGQPPRCQNVRRSCSLGQGWHTSPREPALFPVTEPGVLPAVPVALHLHPPPSLVKCEASSSDVDKVEAPSPSCPIPHPSLLTTAPAWNLQDPLGVY